MAQHKVPQDVETADKLVGFLSLKQFLFVLAGFGLGFIAFNFAKVNFLLAIPFAPPIIVLFVLGLYQRKDQPVEVFLAAWLKFKLNPKTRVWNQEGYEQRVIVTAPKKEVIDYTKGLSRSDVTNKLSSLSSNLDTGGWATRGVRSQDSTQLLEEGEAGEERLISLDEIRSKQQETSPQPDQPIDVFDANNAPEATRIESQIDHAAQEARQTADQILDSHPTTPTANLEPHLTKQQRSEVQNLASIDDAPISAIASRASEAVDLDEGAVFSVH